MTKKRKHTQARSARAKTHDDALRGRCEILAMWAACENPACRQAYACRGAIDQCAKINFRRLPPPVQAFYVGLVLGREEGLSFDEVVAGFADGRAPAAFIEWVERAEAGG
jgi:hypothetical protein